MPYNNDMQWRELTALLQRTTRAVMLTVTAGKVARDDWTSFRDGRDDATLATYFDTGGGGRPGTTATEVLEMRTAFGDFQDCFDFCDDVSGPVQGDRMGAWRKFS